MPGSLCFRLTKTEVRRVTPGGPRPLSDWTPKPWFQPKRVSASKLVFREDVLICHTAVLRNEGKHKVGGFLVLARFKTQYERRFFLAKSMSGQRLLNFCK